MYEPPKVADAAVGVGAVPVWGLPPGQISVLDVSMPPRTSTSSESGYLRRGAPEAEEPIAVAICDRLPWQASRSARSRARCRLGRMVDITHPPTSSPTPPSPSPNVAADRPPTSGRRDRASPSHPHRIATTPAAAPEVSST